MKNFDEYDDDLKLVVDEEYEAALIKEQRAAQKELKERLRAEYISAKIFTELYENCPEEFLEREDN